MKNTRKKHAKYAALALTLSLGFVLSGCGKEQENTSGTQGNGTTVVTPDKPTYGAGVTNLSADVTRIDVPAADMEAAHGNALSRSGVLILQKVMEQEKNGNANYLISPISMQMALGMTATGATAGSDTEKGMMSVLLPGTAENAAALNKEMATFANRMLKAEDVSWNVANSIWVKNSGELKLRDTFISDATNYYTAELYAAPFDSSTLDAINGWVKENTRDRIPTILERLPKDAMMALVNALAFDGEWEEEYDAEDIREKITFTNADGTQSEVTMLRSKEQRAIHLAGGLGFIRNYKGGQYSFVGILPPEGVTTEKYLSDILSGKESFAEQFLNAESKKVYVSIPEFKTEYGKTMDDVLKSLGMEKAYTDFAEFGAMVTEDSQPLKIGTVIHKTMIEVDRKGTKAAASTAVIMTKATAVMEPEETYTVNLNRPFVYAIVDNATGVPVFLGAQNSME